MTEARPEAGRRGMAHHPGLDGVRASALLMIMLYHADPTWIPGGFISVSLFFTLSGYLITSLLVFEGEANGRVSLRSFWERRLRRLAPAALLALVAVVLLSAWLGSAAEQARVRGDAVSAALYVANWHSIFAGHSYAELFSDESPLQHLWSLSIEEQLYVLVPLVVAIGFVVGLRRRGIGVVFVVLSVVSVLAAVIASDHDRIYYGTDTRAVELFGGAALACFLAPRLERWATGRFRWWNVLWLLPLVGFVWFSRIVESRSEWLYDGWLGVFVLLNIPFCIGSLLPGPMRWIMSLAPLTLLGRMSYGIYLAHWPVYVWIDEDLVGWSGWPLLGVRFVVTFALAALSYRLVEKPIRARRVLAGNRPALVTLVATFPAVVLLPLLVLPGDSSNGRDAASDGPVVLATVAPSVPGDTVVQGDTVVPGDTVVSGDTVVPVGEQIDPDAAIEVLVIGDSVAENIALALSRAADGRLGVVSGGVLGCPLQKVELVHRRVDEDQATDYCPDNVALVTDRIERIDVVFVVASVANQWDYRPLGSTERVVVGSARYEDDLDAWLDDVRAVTVPARVPVVFLESPRVSDEPMLNGDTAEPRGAWNSVMTRWDAEFDDVAVVAYDDLLADPDSDVGRAQRPDGTHLDEDFGVELARRSLIPRLRAAWAGAMRSVDES